MDPILSVHLLTPSTRYSEWKLKMIAYLKRQGLYVVSIGLGKECFSENDWLNKCDGDFGRIALGLSPSLRYLTRSIEDPKELWTRLDRTFGMIDEDHNITLERISSTISILDPKFSASTLSDEVVQMKKKQYLLHSQFELKTVSMQ